MDKKGGLEPAGGRQRCGRGEGHEGGAFERIISYRGFGERGVEAKKTAEGGS